MATREAWAWFWSGLVGFLGGLALLHVGDGLALVLWGVAIALLGGTQAAVGASALLVCRLRDLLPRRSSAHPGRLSVCHPESS